ncbi:MAG: DoxX family protein [Bacteroidales bacterium]|nr:DoxX family protein [Bacteroidales bacterium]
MKETKGTHILNIVCRWLVGLTFIFSGFVKGVDPMGTVYKIQEYMTAWSIGSFTFEWALPMAGFLSVALVTLEFTIGVMLLTNCYRRLTAWVLAGMMLFFTTTTLIDAITNKVTDCGCFGEAIKLTNWQTFWKNVALMVPTVFIFLQRKQRWNYKRHFERETLISIVAMACMIIFAIWNINNEPCIDFRAWKVGNQMMPTDEKLEVKNYLVYRNKATGDTMGFDSKRLMDYCKDAEWVAQWEWDTTYTDDPYIIKADGFSMLGPDGEDYARDLLMSDDYLLIATIHHIADLDPDGIKALKSVKTYCENNGIYMVMLCAFGDDVEMFLVDNDLSDMEYYVTDNKAIETMLRSNPGFCLMQKAKVMGKWHYRNIRNLFNYNL